MSDPKTPARVGLVVVSVVIAAAIIITFGPGPSGVPGGDSPGDGTVETGDAGQRPLVGAIRWDAWTGGGVTEQVERTLGPARYHDRLPWFARVLGEDEVEIDGGRQEVMDREIDFAADAGLDYWAFLVYPEESPMSAALGQYLKSSKRGRIGFCLIMHNTLGVDAGRWPAERDRAIALMKEPGYQRVSGGRPLVYAFVGKAFPFERFEELLAAAGEAGLEPYSVYMGWNPASDFEKVSTHGFDAVSSYAMGSDRPAFADLVEAVETRTWKAAADGSVPFVPLVTTGWDKRPRKDHPVSWEIGHRYHEQEIFPARATPGEIAVHLERAIEFVETHPDICPARAIIVYAWNEYDEGGWLGPTWMAEGPDSSRLEAVKKVLKRLE